MNVRTISRCFAKCGLDRLTVEPELPIVIDPEMTIQNEENEDGCIFPPLVTAEELFEEAIANMTKTQMQNTLTLDNGKTHFH